MMTKSECAGVLAFLSAGIRIKLAKESADVYWEMLSDLPLDVLRTAAKRVMLEHVWQTFPSIAEIRQAAAQAARGSVTDISPAEAWAMASTAAANMDPDIRGPYFSGGKLYPNQAAMVLDGLPTIVVKAMRTYGLNALCLGDEPMGVVRGQFLKIYEQLAESEKTRALLPAALTKEIESRVQVENLLQQIGVEP